MFLGKFVATLTIGGLFAVAALGCGTAAGVSSGVSTTDTAQASAIRLGSVPTAAVDYVAEVFSIAGQSGRSDIGVEGVVTKMDEPRWNSADGKQWTPKNEESTPMVYETFYVEPSDVLKGTPKWGSPVAYRVWINTDWGAPSLAVGDRVVAFGEVFTSPAGSEAVYQPAGAYWLSGDNNGLWVEKDGRYQNQGHMTDATEQSLTLKGLEDRVVSALGVTTTVPGQFPSPPATDAITLPGGDTDISAPADALHKGFLDAIQKGDVQAVRASLVEERKVDAEKLCADAAQWQKDRGPLAAWGGFTSVLEWTGNGYAGEPTPVVPDALTEWIKAHPDRRVGLQVVMGDNALWWFGMERRAGGTWLAWPGPRDTEYALTHTLAGLDTLKVVATPRPGVTVTVRLQQLPDSGSVSADVTVKNGSDSVFTLKPSDITLVVDGVLASTVITPHAPGIIQVQPGRTDNPGNGWGWGFDTPTSRTTRLTYTPSDAASGKRAWVAESSH